MKQPTGFTTLEQAERLAAVLELIEGTSEPAAAKSDDANEEVFYSTAQRKWFFSAGPGAGGGGGGSPKGGGGGSKPNDGKAKNLPTSEAGFRAGKAVGKELNQVYSDWMNHVEENNPGQFNSIDNYVGAGYEEINGYLRGSVSKFEMFDTLPGVKHDISNLDKALADAPGLPFDTLLFRGFESEKIYNAVKSGKLTPGSILKDKAFASTSTDEKVSKNFQGYVGDRVMYRIKAKAGAKGAYINDYENEFLIPRGTPLIVTGAHHEKGVAIVELYYE